MQNFNIIKENQPKKSFRTDYVIGKFDLQSDKTTQVFKGCLDLPKNWNIGLIVGNSGTGKSTIAKHLFLDNFINFDFKSDSILNDFPQNISTDDICKMFNSVGFSSPTSWLKPYSVLSNGEKMRVELAYSLLSDKDLIIFDEFTSVVDRNIAKIGSFAVQKALRKTNKKFIAVSCHFDIIEWLLPDWIFNTNDMTFHLFEGQKKNRPGLNIAIYEWKDKTIWNMFAQYHYLSHSHNNAAKVFIMTVNNVICGFSSVLPFPHPKLKNYWKEHRTVILPDYQGIGLGNYLSNYVGNLYSQNGKTFISTTSNPAMIEYRKKSKNWICTRIGRCSSGSGSGKIQNKNVKNSTSCERITTSWKYIIK